MIVLPLIKSPIDGLPSRESLRVTQRELVSSYTQSRTSIPLVLLACVMALTALVLCACAGYWTLFTTWASYDDEGYVLVTLQHHRLGYRLYDDVFTQYGPAFYQIEEVVQALWPHELTSDTQRIKTLIAWLGTATLSGLAVCRLTRDWRVAVAGGIAIFLHLDRLALEPGHPQIWCALLTAILLAMFTWEPDSPSRNLQRLDMGRWGCIGGVCGILFMIKPNIGAFALAGALSGIMWTAPTKHFRSWRIVDAGFTLSLLSAVWLLFAVVLNRAEAGLVPLVVSVSLLMIQRQCSETAQAKDASSATTWTALASMSLGGLSCIAISLVIVVSEGTTRGELLSGMAGQHAELIKQFYHSPPIPSLAWFGCVSMLLMLVASYSPRLATIIQPYAKRYLSGAIAALGLYCLLSLYRDSGTLLVHGLQPRGAAGALAGLGSLVTWRLLTPATISMHAKPLLPSRAALVAVAALAPLAAFPTPGTQLAVGTVALWVVLMAVVAQAVKQLPSYASQTWSRTASCSLIVCFGIAVASCLPAYQRWSTREPLNLGGAYRLRLSPEETLQFRELIGTIKSTGAESIAFAWHNRNSFYGWANLPPASPQSPTFWPYLLSENQQNRVASDMEKFRKVAVLDEVYNPAISPRYSPLQEQLLHDSYVVGDTQAFTIRLLEQPPEARSQ